MELVCELIGASYSGSVSAGSSFVGEINGWSGEASTETLGAIFFSSLTLFGRFCFMNGRITCLRTRVFVSFFSFAE